MKQSVIIIGSGFAGLSAASFMAKAGWDVTVLEKHEQPGGRARRYKAAGFTFDMGPSWYWMPDIFERYFKAFGKKVSDYYALKRLDPSYRVYFEKEGWDIPANYKELQNLLESVEPGAAKALDAFMAEAKFKYDVGVGKLVHNPGLSLTEFLDMDLVKGVFKLDVFQSMKKHVAKFFKHPSIQSLMEFPVLFLGALPEKTPALYSLMNYADIALGTWYPKKGMHEIIKGMVQLAEEKGVTIRYSAEVEEIEIKNGIAQCVRLKSGEKISADVIVAGADYHHVDRHLLNPAYSNYSEDYWDKRVMAPSSLLFYLGINKRLNNLRHHNLFFDEPLGPHADAIYTNPRWPDKPLFYASVPSITDPTVAPEGMENMFLLIPLAPDLEDSEEMREKYYHIIMDRLEKISGQEIRSHVIYKRSYAHSDFKSDYHAFKGNAYGLANTLLQTAILKPGLKNKKVPNLYYTGQLTVPGPGVPPSLISGGVVAKEVMKENNL